MERDITLSTIDGARIYVITLPYGYAFQDKLHHRTYESLALMRSSLYMDVIACDCDECYFKMLAGITKRKREINESISTKSK
jgi:hypothetical protein